MCSSDLEVEQAVSSARYAAEGAIRLQKRVAQGVEQIAQEAELIAQEADRAVSSARRASEGAIRLQERIARDAQPWDDE